ncbi:hypothetical protein [Nocardiopsis dassonvillei]|uniref:hypothetical protein n=1 Tax=Nocardiopsis dassonvillei TaxID=2014 RepID=UPI00157CA521|nr:hypothetical protein [Nocardiopsis dassonvillei]
MSSKLKRGKDITSHVLSEVEGFGEPSVVCSYTLDPSRSHVTQMIEALQRLQADEMAKPYENRSPAIVEDAPR